MKKKGRQKKPPPIGIKIRAARLSKGMSQMKLAEKIGVSYQQLQKYENGRSELTVKRLRQFSDVLNLPISYFMDDGDARRISETDITYGELDRNEIKLIRLLRKANNRKFTLRLIETIRSIVES